MRAVVSICKQTVSKKNLPIIDIDMMLYDAVVSGLIVSTALRQEADLRVKGLLPSSDVLDTVSNADVSFVWRLLLR